jgi:hypothetical protein
MPSERRSKRQRAAAVAAAIRASVLGAGVLVLFALLAIVNYLGWKYHARFDWTETSIYTLSETTEQVLDELDEEVRVTVFITPGSRLYEPTRELLSRYEAKSDRLAVRWLDPERNPVEAQNLVEEYEVSVLPSALLATRPSLSNGGHPCIDWLLPTRPMSKTSIC